MKILFDYQIFQLQKFGGISRYFFELVTQFNTCSDIEWTLPIRYSDNEYLKGSLDFKNVIPFPSAPSVKENNYKNFMWGWHFKGKWQLYSLKKNFFPAQAPKPTYNYLECNKQLTIEKLKRGKYDIFHPTYYDPYFLEYIGNKPFVLTVYDMIHELFPEYFIHSQEIGDKKLLIERANKIIAISESTKRDIIQLHNVPEEKISVVYLANSLQFASDSEKTKAGRVGSRYLLYVGQREIYKNFYFFVQAILPLLEEDKQLYIICTGPPFNNNEVAFFNKHGLINRIIYQYAEESELSLLYSKAIALIYPSLYEGFGIPILEAFQCKCPVITSNTSSIPEVGGEAVRYFDPKNTYSIRNVTREIIYDENSRERLISLGEEQLKKFSWKLAAEETKKVYLSALNSLVIE